MLNIMRILIIFYVIMFIAITTMYSYTMDPCWGDDAHSAYHNIVNKYGKPDKEIKCTGGSAIWKNEKRMENEPYVRIAITDKYKPCVRITMDYYIDQKNIAKVKRISPGVWYDSLLEEVTVGGSSLNRATALMVVLDKVNKGITMPSEIHSGLLDRQLKLADKESSNNYLYLQSLKDTHLLKKKDYFLYAN